jgi:pimeloyl-ACP methyl ester carboxylesterase
MPPAPGYDAAPEAREAEMSRFVLVHGAFSGAWCWEPVVPELEAAGHSVEAIDLPGSGEDRTPLAEVTLDAYAASVGEALARVPERAVLVGHSMGGIAITQAAARAPERVASLIYVCAFLPADGQSLADLVALPEAAGDQVQANMVVEGDPAVATMPATSARDAVYGCCDDQQVAWAVERRGAQPVAPFGAPVELGGDAFAALPRAYVVCARDRSIPPALQRRMLAEAGCREVVELDTDHAPYLSRPGELAAALDRLAR